MGSRFRGNDPSVPALFIRVSYDPSDMLTVAIQQGINGLVVGSLYVLVALGLTLIYGVLVQINFAHADIVTLGAFAAYFFTTGFGGNYLASIGVALLVGAALGFLINAAVF